jgi:N-acetylglucosamine malate deacetylase 2
LLSNKEKMTMKFRFLYIFPHPDDECFGPAAAMHSQLKEGHEVFLLTLTKGGATKQRHNLGVSIEEMGEIRYQEMLDVEKTLNLTSMEVLDLPDSGMKEMDPRLIEKIVYDKIVEINPDIIVSYPVHGISAFHDHLVTHAVVKRVYWELMDNKPEGLKLKRLAFFTLRDNCKPVWMNNGIRVKNSVDEEIDCVMPLNNGQIDAMVKGLECYTTYKDTIKESDVVKKIGSEICFEFYNEDIKPPVSKIEEGL